MEQKIAYQTNEQGIYVGEVGCQPSPMEPGVFLIPGGATEIEPPTIPEGKQAKLVDGAWVLEAIPVVEAVVEQEETQEEKVEVASTPKKPKKK